MFRIFLIALFILFIDTNLVFAQVMGNGLLNAREYTIVGCDYGQRNGNNCVNPNITGERNTPGDTPITLYMPSFQNNGQVINNVCGADQINNTGVPASRATSTTCGPATSWPGAAATPTLISKIFTGVDAFGLPDIPDVAASLWDDVTGKANGSALNLIERTNSCTSDEFVIQDVGGSSCGQMSTVRASTDWAITEGFIVMPPTASGTVFFSSNNVGKDGTARTNYVAMYLSPDFNFANLQFVGEAESRFRVPSDVVFSADASPTDDVCDVNFQAMRLYVHDDFSGASSTVTWSLDGGATFEPIPANRYANDANAAGLVCGDRGDAPDSYLTLNASGGPVHAEDTELYLGSTPAVDDNDGQPTATADGDDTDADGDDEDGTDPATWPLVLQNMTTYSVDVVVNNSNAVDAQLVGWIDFNFDGDFNDPGERSLPATPADCPNGNADVGSGSCTFANGNVPANSGTSTYTLSWADVTIDGSVAAIQDTYARFRVTTDPSFFSDASVTPGGVVADGEVEDFLVAADTLPVTLSSFSSLRSNSFVDIDWGTSSELFNVGFQLWGLDGTNSKWTRLHNWLVKSGSGNAVESQSYSKRIRIPASINQLVSLGLSSVDSNGSEHYYGPFEPGKSYGDLGALEPIPWTAVRNELNQSMLAQGYVRDRVLGYRKINQTATPHSGSESVVEFKLSETGMYRISAQSLLTAGTDWTDVSHKDIALLNNKGEPVVRYVVARGTGTGLSKTLGLGGDIYFYGQTPALTDALYSDNSVYRLMLDPNRALQAPIQTRQGISNVYSQSYREYSEVELDETYVLSSAADDPWVDRVVVSYSDLPGLHGVLVPVESNALWEAGSRLHMRLARSSGLSAVDADADGIVDAEHVAEGLALSNGELASLGRQTATSTGSWNLSYEIPATIRLDEFNGAVLIGGSFTAGKAYRFSEVHIDAVGLEYSRPYVAKQDDDYLLFTAPNEGELGYEVSVPDLGWPWVFASDGNNLVRILHERIPQRQSSTDGKLYRQVQFAPLLGSQTTPFENPVQYWVSAKPGFKQVKAMAGKSILSQSELLAQAQGSDYLLVSHPMFMGRANGSGRDYLAEYKAFKQSQGYSVTIVNYLDIVDAYGGGQAGPGGLTQYLSKLKAQASGVVHVLLVGGSTYDHTDKLQTGAVTFIPAHYGESSYSKFTVSDMPYVMNETGNAFASIGRWPVRSLSDLQVIVDNSMQWANTDHSSGRALLIAEHSLAAEGLDFGQALNTVASELPGAYQQSKVYVNDILANNPSMNLTQALKQAKDEIISHLNTGPDVVLYNGHASTQQLSNQNLFKASDVSRITTSNAQLWLPLSCYVTYYESIHSNTLAQRLMFSSKVVNISGAMLLSNQSENLEMGRSILNDTLTNRYTLGEAVNSAKAAQNDPGLNINWSILGDPTARF